MFQITDDENSNLLQSMSWNWRFSCISDFPTGIKYTLAFSKNADVFLFLENSLEQKYTDIFRIGTWKQ